MRTPKDMISSIITHTDNLSQACIPEKAPNVFKKYSKTAILGIAVSFLTAISLTVTTWLAVENKIDGESRYVTYKEFANMQSNLFDIMTRMAEDLESIEELAERVEKSVGDAKSTEIVTVEPIVVEPTSTAATKPIRNKRERFVDGIKNRYDHLRTEQRAITEKYIKGELPAAGR